MKKGFFACAFFGCLFLFVSSCADQSKPARSEYAQQQRLNDNQIVKILMTIDKGEIDTSKEATRRKVSPSVDLYAKYIIQQHQDNLDALNKLAKQLDLDPKESDISKNLEENGKRDHKALDEARDQAFDKAYVDTMVKGHREGLELIETKLLPQTTNPQLKAFMEDFRNMVAEHLEKGLQLQRTLQ